MSSEAMVVHSGGCHCRSVRWQVEAPGSVVAWICNCSDCSMRGNVHFVVPAARFSLAPGAGDFLTTYTFGTRTAKHTFCKLCGISSFYTPRSNPDGVAITVACVDPGRGEARLGAGRGGARLGAGGAALGSRRR
ncbi:hypothetical protein GUJ93_ZPchr0010g7833 [Zizania palustris]|uniref:CENP-V/GFA domain-containing protein n=1 Tax=Zizania palustris TaxID=103762 RepID=A0A8J5W170_ZIZPA|nr:hypothetical protein GUJ93_ZPchr0001g32905 [Zizania palustris]KAG8083776.1 hypothetical protein GUJ93_ZPchr0010g7833 [Zizania palustris]